MCPMWQFVGCSTDYCWDFSFFLVQEVYKDADSAGKLSSYGVPLCPSVSDLYAEGGGANSLSPQGSAPCSSEVEILARSLPVSARHPCMVRWSSTLWLS